MPVLLFPLGWDQSNPVFLKTCTLCRLILLPEDTLLLCWLSSLEQQPGLPLPPYQEHCPVLELRLWEAGSGWMGVIVMMDSPPDLRWWLKSDDGAHCQSCWWLWYYNSTKGGLWNDNQWSSLNLFCLSGAGVSASTLEPVGAGWRSGTGKIWPCHPLYWTRAACLFVFRWKFQHRNDNQGDVRVGGWLINKEVLVLMIIMMIIMIISNDIITWIHSLVVISEIPQS